MIEQRKRMKARRPFYSMFGLLVLSCLLASVAAQPIKATSAKAVAVPELISAESDDSIAIPLDIQLSLSTDESVYGLGDYAYITAGLLGDYSLMADAEVMGEVISPTGVSQEITFTSPEACYSYMGDCPEGEICSYVPEGTHCDHTYQLKLSQTGRYQIKAHIVGANINAVTEFSVIAIENEYDLSLSTDKDVYSLGESVQLSATLSSSEAVSTPSTITASVSLPTGMSQIVFMDQDICEVGACECPEGETCDCDDWISCEYGTSFNTYLTGKHLVSATAEIAGESLSAKTDFLTKGSSEYLYTRLNSKFELLSGQTAVVVDYDDLKIMLNDITVACSVEGGCSYFAYINASKGDESLSAKLVKDVVESLFGLQITVLNIDSDSATFILEKYEEDVVDIRISPVTQTVPSDSIVQYNITLKDKHAPEYQPWSSHLYAYDLQLVGLPFATDYERFITLLPGESRDILLTVDSSERLLSFEAIATDNSVREVEASATFTASAQKAYIQPVKVTTEEAIEQTNIMKISQPQEDEDTGIEDNVYSFRVEVFERSESRGVMNPRIDVAYAKLIVTSDPPELPDTLEIPISSGWNLVSLPGVGTMSKGTCGQMHAFVYLADGGQYMSLEDASGEMGADQLQEYLSLHPFWVYSYTDCHIGFQKETSVQLSEFSLEPGWNFVPIIEEMIGSSLSELSSDCSLEESYLWDAEQQEWERISESRDFRDSDLYSGFITKAESYCELGWGVLISPPAIP